MTPFRSLGSMSAKLPFSQLRISDFSQPPSFDASSPIACAAGASANTNVMPAFPPSDRSSARNPAIITFACVPSERVTFFVLPSSLPPLTK